MKAELKKPLNVVSNFKVYITEYVNIIEYDVF